MNKSYLILEGKNHGKYSYPDLMVGTTRLSYDDEVKKAAKKLNLTLQNTQEENNGTNYIGNINWNDALKLNLTLDSFTLNLRQYLDFLKLLKSGKAFYADGTKADKKILDNILDEIIKVRNPYRSEWIDADLKFNNNELSINYDHKLVNNQLVPQRTELLEDCLIEDKTPGIDLDDLLINATYQGLPKKNVKSGSMYYWCPDKDNNSVAGFNADSDGTDLSYGWDPADSDVGHGVRRAKNFTGNLSKENPYEENLEGILEIIKKENMTKEELINAIEFYKNSKKSFK